MLLIEKFGGGSKYRVSMASRSYAENLQRLEMILESAGWKREAVTHQRFGNKTKVVMRWQKEYFTVEVSEIEHVQAKIPCQ